jgi:hypothetical protein
MQFRGICLAILGFATGAFAVGLGVHVALDRASASATRMEAEVFKPEPQPDLPPVAEVRFAPASADAGASTLGSLMFGVVAPASREGEPAAEFTPAPSAPAPVEQAAAAPTEKAPVPEARPAPAKKPSTELATRASHALRDETQKATPFLTMIARMKRALNLTSEQEPHWRAVEVKLREIAARQPQGKNSKIAIDANAAQELYWVAAPLIMSLREDQKRAAKLTARSFGLDEVASAL